MCSSEESPGKGFHLRNALIGVIPTRQFATHKVGMVSADVA
jgi:hypothetical protein